MVDYEEVRQELLSRAQVSDSQLAESRDLAQRYAKHRSKSGSGRFGATGRHERGIPQPALKNAINTEGPEIMSEEGEGYWKDMERLYPEIKPHQDICIPAVGAMKNRLGIISEKTIYHGDGTKTTIRDGAA